MTLTPRLILIPLLLRRNKGSRKKLRKVLVNSKVSMIVKLESSSK